jgi:hypothetical protein
MSLRALYAAFSDIPSSHHRHRKLAQVGMASAISLASIHVVDAITEGSLVMFTTTHSNPDVSRGEVLRGEVLRSGVCLLLSVLIVGISLICGALGVQSLESRALDVSTQIRSA